LAVCNDALYQLVQVSKQGVSSTCVSKAQNGATSLKDSMMRSNLCRTQQAWLEQSDDGSVVDKGTRQE
jgi:hypothetical protein